MPTEEDFEFFRQQAQKIADMADYKTQPAAKPSRNVNDLCGWKVSDNEECEPWETSCGNSFEIIAGTPADNGFVYCPFCGRKIHEIELPRTEYL